jgi:hypothetical protein
MTEALRFVPPRVAFVDISTGMIAREWYLFLQGLFNRVGGANGSSTTDLVASLFEDAGSSETNARLFAVEQALGQAPLPFTPTADSPSEQLPAYQQFVQLDALQTELYELRETVAELKKDLDAIRQGTLL